MKVQRSLIFLLIISLSSCVSSKKYQLLEEQNSLMSNRIDRLEQFKIEGDKAAEDLKDTREKLDNTESILLELNSKYNGLQDSYFQLEKRYEEVILRNKELLDVTAKEKSTLLNELNEKQVAIDEQKALLNAREEKIQVIENRIAELENRLAIEQQKMDSLQNNLSNALFVFGPKDLSIEQKDGKIYVSLSQKLLFQKGSDLIDTNGKNAILKLAEVLRESQDIDIIVEGHTDSDGSPSTNWDLSTRRATTVVKLLQENGVPPENLTASGRALYDPIVENDSEENMSKNRRTEIIISPKLDQIMQMIREN